MLFLIKFIGMSLIVVSSTLIGISKSRQLKERVLALEWYFAATIQIADKIRFSNQEISKIIYSLHDNKRYLSISNPFKVLPTSNNLNADDKKVVSLFLENLGVGDTDNQLNICSMYGKELSLRLDKARQEMREKTKVFKNFGFFIGLGIAIILI